LDWGASQLEGISNAPRRDAERLMMHLLNCDLAFLFAHPDQSLSPAQSKIYESLIARRQKTEPIQYITGEQEFFGLAIKVTPEVLIPRPETEHLVEALVSLFDRDSAPRIADVGTGSGAIAITAAHSLPHSSILAIDRSAEALEIACENAIRYGLHERIQFRQADLLLGVEEGSLDAVVSNPPYIADGEIVEAQVEKFEPRMALYAGPTGLEVYERLVPQARAALRPGGWLLLEMGFGQQPALANLLKDWAETRFIDDLRGIPRVAVARNPGARGLA
jgi:release factor glutamine methyltransferase